MAKHFLNEFAKNGDRVAIQDDSQADGLVSYESGYTPQYSLDLRSDPTARRLSRDRFNQLNYDVTSNIKEWQEQLYPAFITSAENGGVPFAYRKGVIVDYNGEFKESLVNDNVDLPSVAASWGDPSGVGTVVPIDKGGTGATTATQARANLELGDVATLDVGASSDNSVLRRVDGDGRYLQSTDGTVVKTSGDQTISGVKTFQSALASSSQSSAANSLTRRDYVDTKEPALAADRKRKITISTADPSGGSVGDIWLKY